MKSLAFALDRILWFDSPFTLQESRSLSQSMESVPKRREKWKMNCVPEQEMKLQIRKLPVSTLVKYVTFVHPSFCLCGRRCGIPIRFLSSDTSSIQSLHTLNFSLLRTAILSIPSTNPCTNSSPEEDPAQYLKYQTAEDHESKETCTHL